MMRERFLGTIAMIALLGAAPPSISQIDAAPALEHAIVAGEVYDLDTHRVLYARNATTLMLAASTTKLLTEGTSLALLGPDFRWTTPVYRVGSVDTGGRLHGDLVLVASGDPNLSQRIQSNGSLAFENEDHSYDGSYDTKAVPGDPLAVLRELASQVRKSGITYVDGNVAIDASLFPNGGPEYGTGAYIAPIVVNDNLVDVTITPGTAPGDAASIAVSPQTPYVTFIDKATTGDTGTEPTIDMSNDVAQPDGSHRVTITGAIPAGHPILFAYRVTDPERFARDAFIVALHDAGVSVDTPAGASVFDPAVAKDAYTAANLVAKHVSPPLSEDVYVTLKVSDNLHAGLGPYTWAVHAGATSDFVKAGFALERKLLHGAGLDLSQASQQDGLGYEGYFTPDFMVHYLAWVRAQSWFPALFRALPVMGVDGTLFNIENDSPAHGKVHAKTGSWGTDDNLNANTIVSAKGLAGYITTRKGHHVAFAFYINRMSGKSSIYTDRDVTHAAGELLGQMATATYESL
jgi:PBP4 family serine-type D-alanyl-D-alanine carboxypeptidase